MKTNLVLSAILAGGMSVTHAATVSLASTMNGSSYMSEDTVTGGFSRINMGNGSLGSAGANTGDADGHYLLSNFNNPSASPLGTSIDTFPREANFQVGNITYNEAGLTGIGVETVAITTIDLAAFWTSDPNRTSNTAGSTPTVISDISDHALGLWLFNGPGAITFGSLDASDTITFTNGVLTSINLQLATTFSASAFGMDLAWNGTFSIDGADLSYQIDDVESTFVGESRFVANLTGRVNSVIPEPSSLALGAAGLLVLLRRRR